LPVIQFTVKKDKKQKRIMGSALYLRALADLQVFGRKEKRISFCPGTCLNKIGYERFFGQPSVLRRD